MNRNYYCKVNSQKKADELLNSRVLAYAASLIEIISLDNVGQYPCRTVVINNINIHNLFISFYLVNTMFI